MTAYIFLFQINFATAVLGLTAHTLLSDVADWMIMLLHMKESRTMFVQPVARHFQVNRCSFSIDDI